MLYKGVITNNKDPDQLGRYQVRIFGLVDGNKSGFGVSNNADLQWAEAVGSTAFGNIGGVVKAPNRNVQINGRNVACVGDAESCGGTIVTGSTDVSIGK